MWFWQKYKRTVPGDLSLADAVSVANEHGFSVLAEYPRRVVLHRRGTESGLFKMLPDGEDVPIKLVITTEGAGLVLRLTYDGVMLFDTGDLAPLADELACDLAATEAAIAKNAEDAQSATP